MDHYLDDDNGLCGGDYNTNAEFALVLAARSQCTEVAEELVTLATRYRQLAEFTTKSVAPLRLSIEKLCSDGEESPTNDGDSL